MKGFKLSVFAIVLAYAGGITACDPGDGHARNRFTVTQPGRAPADWCADQISTRDGCVIVWRDVSVIAAICGQDVSVAANGVCRQ